MPPFKHVAEHVVHESPDQSPAQRHEQSFLISPPLEHDLAGHSEGSAGLAKVTSCSISTSFVPLRMRPYPPSPQLAPQLFAMTLHERRPPWGVC